MRTPTLIIAVALGVLSACSDMPLAPAPTPAVDLLLAADDPSCDPTTAIIPCDEEPGGGVFGWPFFGPPNDLLYQAPGDPSPGSPGLWLGGNVTPAACFADKAASIVDADKDWLADHCELEIARGFAPTMKFSRKDGCPNGEPYWAAKYFTSGHVRIAYMPAYYDDCGPWGVPFGCCGPGHHGDSEFILVEVRFNAGTQHWEFAHMWLSAHYGSDGNRSAWVTPAQAQFTHRTLTHPTVWVAIAKHGNYKSSETCNKTVWGDECGWSPLDPLRFPITPSHNAGSRFVDLKGCVPSEKRFAGNGRLECFYTAQKFRGWHTTILNDESTAYANFLNGQFFEQRCVAWQAIWGFQMCTSADPGPGPNAPPAYTVAMSGPGYAYDETVSVTATPVARGGGTPGGLYYTWYEQWCRNGTAPGDCDYQWHYRTEGTDARTIQGYVSRYDNWVQFFVEVRNTPGGPVIASGTHFVSGGGESTGGCGTQIIC